MSLFFSDLFSHISLLALTMMLSRGVAQAVAAKDELEVQCAKHKYRIGKPRKRSGGERVEGGLGTRGAAGKGGATRQLKHERF
jgi:hypothetical protein